MATLSQMNWQIIPWLDSSGDWQQVMQHFTSYSLYIQYLQDLLQPKMIGFMPDFPKTMQCILRCF